MPARYTLRIATRQSPLALWQANFVKQTILATHPQLIIEIIGFVTEGDKKLASSLSKIGGKGLFVKELETALLEQRADIAVHSIKDMPAQPTAGLTLAAICEREDPRDALLSPHFACLEDLPAGAVVGTSSSRRACLLRSIRPDLVVAPLRGNVGTRLQKLAQGDYAAIILAAAGLIRLGQAAQIRTYMPPDPWIPAVGQGAIGIECRADNRRIMPWLFPLEHAPTRNCVTAERAFNQQLGGGCQLPIAAHAIYEDQHLKIQGFVAHPDKDQTIRAELTGSIEHPAALGKLLADLLLQKGADKILAAMA